MNDTPPLQRKLEALCDKLPKVACKGLCTECCGPLAFTSLEAAIIHKYHGVTLSCTDCLACSALVAGQCSIYEHRPYVCRAYGAVEGLECPFGCQPEEGLMPAAEAEKLFHEIMKIGGAIVSTVPKGLADRLGIF